MPPGTNRLEASIKRIQNVVVRTLFYTLVAWKNNGWFLHHPVTSSRAIDLAFAAQAYHYRRRRRLGLNLVIWLDWTQLATKRCVAFPS